MADSGLIYHMLNRANARLSVFEKEADYEISERILELAVEQTGTRLPFYYLRSNHWHPVVNAVYDGELLSLTS